MEKKNSDLEFAPLRSLDDFILESARFQIPNFKDLDKWSYRVINNLIYYQSNYFLLLCLMIFIISIINPAKMFLGMITLLVAITLFSYLTKANRNAFKFKKEHPLFAIVLFSFTCLFFIYMIGSVLVFLFGILLPLAVIFIHASMRLRNIKNKFTNKLEVIGLKKTTPMSILIEEFGMEPDLLS